MVNDELLIVNEGTRVAGLVHNLRFTVYHLSFPIFLY